MKLRDLSVGQKFRFVNGNSKTWEKRSNNGDIAEYNVCLCITELEEISKGNRLAMASFNNAKLCNHMMNKDADVVII
jgi:hypothetical protein